jgi:hypothetical protein
MTKKTTITNKQLITSVAKSCKYYTYEVEDVFEHLIKVLQQELAKGNSVRLTGLGKLKMQKLKIPENLGYDSFRLSIIQDNYMKDYLKEHYVEPTEPTTKMALPNVQ